MLNDAASRLINKLLDEIEHLSNELKTKQTAYDEVLKMSNELRVEMGELNKQVDEYEVMTGRFLDSTLYDRGTKYVHKKEYYRVVDQYNKYRLQANAPLLDTSRTNIIEDEDCEDEDSE